jgi:hypothetical protein
MEQQILQQLQVTDFLWDWTWTNQNALKVDITGDVQQT